MNIKKALPLDPESMVAFFKDKDQQYEIDYAASLENLQAHKFIVTYIANLGLKCNIDLIDPEFMRAYITTTVMADIPNARYVHANILYYAKHQLIMFPDYLELFSERQICEFIEQYTDEVCLQMQLIDSIELYVLTRADGHCQDSPILTECNNQIDDTVYDGLIGFNLLSLFNIDDFLMVWNENNIPLEHQVYYSKYFDEYMFSSRNLYEFMAVEGNLYFGLMVFVTTAYTDERIGVKLIEAWSTMLGIDSAAFIDEAANNAALTNKHQALLRKSAKRLKKQL